MFLSFWSTLRSRPAPFQVSRCPGHEGCSAGHTGHHAVPEQPLPQVVKGRDPGLGRETPRPASPGAAGGRGDPRAPWQDHRGHVGDMAGEGGVSRLCSPTVTCGTLVHPGWRSHPGRHTLAPPGPPEPRPASFLMSLLPQMSHWLTGDAPKPQASPND